MRKLTLVIVAAVAPLGCGPKGKAEAPPPPPPIATPSALVLRPPSAFVGIAGTEERSRALFVEATKVMFHPRCVNCHPNDDSPHQGDLAALHDPPVVRGPEDK